jgi:hypothetical protein
MPDPLTRLPFKSVLHPYKMPDRLLPSVRLE